MHFSCCSKVASRIYVILSSNSQQCYKNWGVRGSDQSWQCQDLESVRSDNPCLVIILHSHNMKSRKCVFHSFILLSSSTYKHVTYWIRSKILQTKIIIIMIFKYSQFSFLFLHQNCWESDIQIIGKLEGWNKTKSNKDVIRYNFILNPEQYLSSISNNSFTVYITIYCLWYLQFNFRLRIFYCCGSCIWLLLDSNIFIRGCYDEQRTFVIIGTKNDFKKRFFRSFGFQVLSWSQFKAFYDWAKFNQC